MTTQNQNAGLLVAVHGSPSPTWHIPLEKLQSNLDQVIEETHPLFSKSVVCNMEYAKPTIPEGVRHLEGAGCERIVCMPLFIAHSSHVVYDIPTILGLLAIPHHVQSLQDEGMEIARPHIPIKIGPTLCESDLLLRSALQHTKEISQNPQEEALVILAHGDPDIRGTWNHTCRRISHYVSSQLGIPYGDWAFVRVGQGYSTEGLRVIIRAANNYKRVLVIGLYLSMGPQRIHQQYVKEFGDPSKYFNGAEVVFSQRGFLPNEEVVSWLVETAKQVDLL